MKEQIQKQLESYFSEQKDVVKAMESLQSEFSICKDRLIEINGAIEALKKTLEMIDDGSESEATSGADAHS